MKPHLLFVTVALATLPHLMALSQPLITVSGSAEVKLPPDEIYLRVGVETHDADVIRAKSRNDEAILRALTFLKESGVDKKNVKTDYISIEPMNPNGAPWSGGSYGEGPAVYVVRKSIEIKLTNMDTFDVIMTGLITNGVNTVQGIDFRTSHLRENRDKARAMAIHAAKEKAQALCAEMGAKVGKVNNINAEDSGGWGYYGGYWGGQYGGFNNQNQVLVQNRAEGPSEPGDGTLSIGQISVSAMVNVSFVIDQ